MRKPVAVVFLLATLTIPAAMGAQLRVVSDRPLSGPAQRALDVRWLDTNAVLVTVFENGVLQVDTRNPTDVRSIVKPRVPPCRQCAHLALSGSYLATAHGQFGIAWKHRGMPESYASGFNGPLIDLDVFQDKIAILGFQRDGDSWAGDGAIGWIGTLDSKLENLTPILFPSGVARPYDCGFFEHGGVRFFPDGSVVFVPALEPGVYLYGPDAKLAYVWQTDKLGFLDRCDITHEQLKLYAGNPEARTQWDAAHAVVDDVLPMKEGPALLVRRVTKGSTHWSLVQLRRNAPTSVVELPFTSASDAASLRADVQGNRIAFIVRVLDEWRGKGGTPTRLIIAQWE